MRVGAPHLYIWNADRTATGTFDLDAWSRWFESADRHVANTADGPIRISTVFLGVDHGFFDDGPPVLYETMVFGGKLDGEQDRYRTYNEAVKGHAEMVRRVTEAERDVREET